MKKQEGFALLGLLITAVIIAVVSYLYLDNNFDENSGNNPGRQDVNYSDIIEKTENLVEDIENKNNLDSLQVN